MKYKAIRGMEDILPQDVGIWQELERKAHNELRSSGYSEIRTPILEETSVFTRSIGETTDIVTKEMYTFRDKKERSFTMRPEGTAPIVRAYIEHSLDKILPDARLYCIGPMFRSERPQKGRSRQFHQIGVEVFGSNSPYADVEVIREADRLLKLFKLSDFTIKLNTLGCKADKDKYAGRLKDYLKKELSRLCADCKTRIDKNVLRVLDCKNEGCIAVVKNAPDIIASLCDGCREHFDMVKNALKALKIDFNETKNLVRGLDYYTGTVFEVTHPALGSQDAIGAGGRYDNLVKDLGGPATGAVGFALGMERIIIALKREAPVSKNVVYIATLGDGPKIHGIQLASEIKEELPDLIVLTDIRASSLKSQMRSADSLGAKLVLIIGDDELKSDKISIHDMIKKDQVSVDKSSVINEVKERLC